MTKVYLIVSYPDVPESRAATVLQRVLAAASRRQVPVVGDDRGARPYDGRSRGGDPRTGRPHGIGRGQHVELPVGVLLLLLLLPLQLPHPDLSGLGACLALGEQPRLRLEFENIVIWWPRSTAVLPT